MEFRTITLALLVLLVVGADRPAGAYPVQGSATLEELEREADLIFKGRALSTRQVEDAWFEPVRGYAPHATSFRVLAVYKGDRKLAKVSFRHYDKLPGDVAMMYMPQAYHFTPGRSYVVFADKTPERGVLRQLWKRHRTKEDQGVLLAADERVLRGKTIKDLFWAELSALLKSKKPDDVIYAIRQLDWLSGGAYEDRVEFVRKRVLATIHGLIRHENEKVAAEAIRALGSRNPYLSDDFAAGWLATIGEGKNLPGFAEWDVAKNYLGAEIYWKELAEVVDSDAPLDNRVLAVRAMGRSKQPKVLALAARWLSDPAPGIRQAAAMLLADFPDQVDLKLVDGLANDSDPIVRVGAARAIGFGRFEKRIPVLGRLLGDEDPKVAKVAAASLLSFPVRQTRKMLEANLDHPWYGPLFVNTLARQDPAPYLDKLGAIIRGGLRVQNWWGGKIPWGESWDILFKYAQGQPAKRLQGGSLDAVLDALESPLARGEPGGGFFSSSEPRDLYALYLQRGLAGRARAFRKVCKRAIPYDMDYYFDMVDKNPGTYQRR